VRSKPAAIAFDSAAIDEVIHGRVRLGIMAYLAAADTADFTTLKAKTQTTDGTLSVHLRKLEDCGYVLVEKTYRGRRPITRVRMSAKGRKAFKAYLDTIAALADLNDD
jgi:DNA-binding MarR family transcriptional regulator